MSNLTIENIEEQTTSSNLLRGKSYFKSGQISEFKITNNRFVQATVTGKKKYKVFVAISKNENKVYCSCPYDSKGYCKHQVAVKLAFIQSSEQANNITIPEKKEKYFVFFNLFLIYLQTIKNKMF